MKKQNIALLFSISVLTAFSVISCGNDILGNIHEKTKEDSKLAEDLVAKIKAAFSGTENVEWAASPEDVIVVKIKDKIKTAADSIPGSDLNVTTWPGFTATPDGGYKDYEELLYTIHVPHFAYAKDGSDTRSTGDGTGWDIIPKPKFIVMSDISRAEPDVPADGHTSWTLTEGGTGTEEDDAIDGVFDRTLLWGTVVERVKYVFSSASPSSTLSKVEPYNILSWNDFVPESLSIGSDFSLGSIFTVSFTISTSTGAPTLDFT
jgi:hypothetical protein